MAEWLAIRSSGHIVELSDVIVTVGSQVSGDTLFVKGDPATRIADIENVTLVFKDGVGYDVNKLLDSVKDRYGEY